MPLDDVMRKLRALERYAKRMVEDLAALRQIVETELVVLNAHQDDFDPDDDWEEREAEGRH